MVVETAMAVLARAKVVVVWAAAVMARAAAAEVAAIALDRRCTRSTWCSRRSRYHRSHRTMPGQCTSSIHSFPCR
eukprot:scaffold20862_cov41-Phaeocystis_antarctica.AAC.4